MQKRAISGKQHEYKVVENGGVLVCKSPKVIWDYEGKNNLDKIINSNFNGHKLLPANNSTYEKYDVILSSGEKMEVKKYSTNKIKGKWILYSEPILKICTKEQVNRLIKVCGSLETAQYKYNKFITELYDNLLNDGELNNILNKLTQTSKGIIFEDCRVNYNDLEFRWVMKNNWMGFKRVILEFKIK